MLSADMSKFGVLDDGQIEALYDAGLTMADVVEVLKAALPEMDRMRIALAKEMWASAETQEQLDKWVEDNPRWRILREACHKARAIIQEVESAGTA